MIIGFDPGKLTGVAIYDEAKHDFVELKQILIDKSYQVIDTIVTTQPSIVIVEKFVLYPWRAKMQGWSDLPAVQIIGVIKTVCDHLGIPLKFQYANQRKFVPQALIDRTSMRELGKKKEHARDAALHVLYYVMTHLEVDTNDEISDS